MIPPVIAALLPAPLTEIIATAAEATPLRQAMEIARGTGSLDPRGVYSRFIGAMTRAGSTVAKARESYAPAKYWADQGKILDQYPEGIAIDPRLARDLPGSGPLAGAFGAVRYKVTVTLTDPATGDSLERYVWITEPASISLEEILALAMERAADDMSPTLKGATGGEVTGWNLSARLSDFGRVV